MKDAFIVEIQIGDETLRAQLQAPGYRIAVVLRVVNGDDPIINSHMGLGAFSVSKAAREQFAYKVWL